jgi:CPA2 family monovalent cation:H+ antiporter-2
VLLSARLSLIIAAAAIGRQMGVINEPMNAAVILVAIVTVTAAPPLFIWILPGGRRARSRRIIVAGASDLGLQVARELRAHLEDVVAVDADAGRLERARNLGFETVAGDLAANDPALAGALDGAHALVCTDADTDRAYRVCHVARGVYGLENVVAQVTDVGQLPRFETLGVRTMNAALDRAALLVMLVRNPAVYALLSRTDDDKEVYEFEIPRAFAGRRIGDLEWPGDSLAVALRRGTELLVPHRETRVEKGDHVTLVGSIVAIEAMRGQIEPVSP